MSESSGAGAGTETPVRAGVDVDELAGALRVSVGMLVRRLKHCDPPGELTLPEIVALSRLDRGGPATSSDLARHDRISPQSMGAIVAALEQRGLVRRERDPGDGRRIVLSLTEAGRRVVHDRRGARTAMIARALAAGFSPAELAQLQAITPLLERLGEGL
ncbi:MAG TPA: MarR family transcriptional regulator [Trebonia sp.]|jgi:DNA-binding MarR family transcriptional regulator|nr:MarR family transcriptional regulator [Trebonia sp.]